MTSEEKDLLLKDLCARLLYGVMLSITHNEYTDETFNARISTIDYCNEVKVRYGFEEYEQAFSLEQIKPYLFPLSSMTGEQKQYLKNRFCYDWDGEPYDLWKYQIEIGEADELIDWLNKNHFDYRSLIPKGLAIDATVLNIY